MMISKIKPSAASSVKKSASIPAGKKSTASTASASISSKESKPVTTKLTNASKASSSASKSVNGAKIASKSLACASSTSFKSTAPKAVVEILPIVTPEEFQKQEQQRKADEDARAAEFARLNGDIVLRYNHYKESFKITNGCLTCTAIDEKYSLSFVFPNSIFHLTSEQPDSFDDFEHPLISKTSPTQFQGLETGHTYWVLIEEDSEEAHKAAERQREYMDRMAREQAEKQKQPALHTEKMESCSCIEGNPCASAYNCKDWKNRYDVAKAHGWKGHS